MISPCILRNFLFVIYRSVAIKSQDSIIYLVTALSKSIHAHRGEGYLRDSVDNEILWRTEGMKNSPWIISFIEWWFGMEYDLHSCTETCTGIAYSPFFGGQSNAQCQIRYIEISRYKSGIPDDHDKYRLLPRSVHSCGCIISCQGPKQNTFVISLDILFISL